jgi:preprotein translocase subunit SecA
MGLEEGEVIQHSMITKSIERAQRKVEENHFGTRKRLIEYDDVMNAQREVIYKRRRHALFGERLQIDINNMIRDVAEHIVNEAVETQNFEQFELDLLRNFGLESPVTQEDFAAKKKEELNEIVMDAAAEQYKEKSLRMAGQAFPIIKEVFETQAATYENITTPITDGMRTLHAVANLKRCYETEGRELVTVMEKGAILAMIDDAWKEHLREMDDLKTSVQNAVYEQKDPLLIYKFESFDLFKRMVDDTNRNMVSFLFRANLPSGNAQNPQVQSAARKPVQQPQPKLQTQREEVNSAPQNQTPQNAQVNRGPGGMPQQAPQPVQQVVRQDPKIGRNDPCPCGSGKKFKSCHGK